ncbi:MAG: hypothetical protein ACERKV_11680 [Clostridiaceae bacterium]
MLVDQDDIEYFNILLETNIFVDVKEMTRYSRADALTLAEKIEKDSILFYSHLASVLKGLADEELKIILAEEKKHLKYLDKVNI